MGFFKNKIEAIVSAFLGKKKHFEQASWKIFKYFARAT
jgi:hypothetical protein